MKKFRFKLSTFLIAITVVCAAIVLIPRPKGLTSEWNLDDSTHFTWLDGKRASLEQNGDSPWTWLLGWEGFVSEPGTVALFQYRYGGGSRRSLIRRTISIVVQLPSDVSLLTEYELQPVSTSILSVDEKKFFLADNEIAIADNTLSQTEVKILSSQLTVLRYDKDTVTIKLKLESTDSTFQFNDVFTLHRNVRP